MTGYSSNAFLVILHKVFLHLTWVEPCAYTKAITFIMKGKTKTIVTEQQFNNVLRLQNSGYDATTITLLASENVELFYAAADLDALLWDLHIIPIDHLGMEYFIVFPKYQADSYFSYVGVAGNQTHISIQLNHPSSNAPVQPRIYKLNAFQHHVIKQNYDYSGSRIISNYRIAVSCTMEWVYFQKMPYQLPPAHTFGKYHVLAQKGDVYNIRIVALHNNTKLLTDTGKRIGFHSHGRLAAIDKENIRHPMTLQSDKPVLLYETTLTSMPYTVKFHIIPPATQYVENYNYLVMSVNVAIETINITILNVGNCSGDFKVDLAAPFPWTRTRVNNSYLNDGVRYMESICLTRGVIPVTRHGIQSKIFHIYVVGQKPYGGYISFFSTIPVEITIISALKRLQKECRLEARNLTDTCGSHCNESMVENCDEDEDDLDNGTMGLDNTTWLSHAIIGLAVSSVAVPSLISIFQ